MAKSKTKAAAKAKEPAKAKSKPKKAQRREPVLNEDTRRIVRMVLGVVCGILTVYTVVALLSYVFTWTADQSLKFNTELFTTGVTADNAGGKIGFLWADFLVSKLFGWGAFAVPVCLGALTV